MPCIVQDAVHGTVLMLAWMNAEALRLTRDTHIVHFWSRSRQTLWKKGETSGNTLALVELRIDCDRDAVLVRAKPAGPTCHTGTTACFFHRDDGPDDDGVPNVSVLQQLLFDLAPRDTATIAGAAALLVALALMAGYLPARRASRVDPIIALRSE